jgi:hypothetical protein
MEQLPVVGREYTYLGSPVTVLHVVPLDEGEPSEAHVEFTTRFGEFGECIAARLSEREDS